MFQLDFNLLRCFNHTVLIPIATLILILIKNIDLITIRLPDKKCYKLNGPKPCCLYWENSFLLLFEQRHLL